MLGKYIEYRVTEKVWSAYFFSSQSPLHQASIACTLVVRENDLLRSGGPLIFF